MWNLCQNFKTFHIFLFLSSTTKQDLKYRQRRSGDIWNMPEKINYENILFSEKIL